MDIFLGSAGAALVVAAFVGGFLFRGHADSGRAAQTTAQTEPTEDEQRVMRELAAEQAAFHDLLGYGADAAYGRDKL